MRAREIIVLFVLSSILPVRETAGEMGGGSGGGGGGDGDDS